MAFTYEAGRVYTKEEKRQALYRIIRSMIGLGILYAGFPLLYLFRALVVIGECGQIGMGLWARMVTGWVERER